MSDPYIWLENTGDQQALAWVKKQNDDTTSHFKQDTNFCEFYDRCLGILNSEKRIFYPTIRGEYLYNFYKSPKNERGIWRRTSYENYFNEQQWEELLDLDKLCEEQQQPWVFKGVEGLYPNYERYMVKLSQGGSDAVAIREYDIVQKSFIEDGFRVPESKTFLSWCDIDTLWIACHVGGLTKSGYPLTLREWKRGTNIEDSKILFRGEEDDVAVYGAVVHTQQRKYKLILRAQTFYQTQHFLYEENQLQRLDIPEDSKLCGFLQDHLILQLKSDWKPADVVYPSGSIVAISFPDFIKGSRDFITVFCPESCETVTSIELTKNLIVINKLKNVRSELWCYDLRTRQLHQVETPCYGSIHLVSSDDLHNRFFYTYSDFLTPPTLYLFEDNHTRQTRQLPHFFCNENFRVQQLMTPSKDGTEIPYFIVSAKDVVYDGNNPTLIKVYGGFEVSLYPHYLAMIGSTWLERGGVYVIANVRGGGEFGPQWHRAAIKENKQRSLDDLFAVTQDIIHRKLSQPRYIGIIGGSNGGLLVASALMQRPKLYNAVICQVPILDMKRYHKLLAGASWIAEYGNPDIDEEWSYMKSYSPYHNVSAKDQYPTILIYTSTKDDRVHPGHARKMVAKMQGMNHKVHYYENLEGGHAGASTHQQQAFVTALSYTYLWKQLGN
ncbi:prolyl oligopeptidase family serine peptidase [Candidatus Uabimicrobium amorphum]|uniref:Prolyl oligopeptidase n=1 Tax=Uabimicrobium amorphum TaxID=2596890 RepID=A0A5S9F386_UABAM|nr:prolyl oligopeptidase family serine peptidase [Candidatus Uabimicrobium amorphum]BBM82902.1 prolyl oligopeptidase [Candidatus Uabimicrobium amorphum]